MDFRSHSWSLKSLSPLLMHNPAAMALSTREQKNHEKCAKVAAYWDVDGDLCFPTVAFRKALFQATRGKKIGRVSLHTFLLPVVLTGEAEWMKLLDSRGKPLRTYEVYVVTVVVIKARVPRARPRIESWQGILNLLIDHDCLPDVDDDAARLADITANLNDAGQKIGVGDWRIEKGGQFGRFTATFVK